MSYTGPGTSGMSSTSTKSTESKSKSNRSSIRKETGAQLLARLTPRPSLANVDPIIFGASSQPNPQANAVPKVIELYGSEGTAKSQLALHLTALTCLSSQAKDFSLRGLGAKVIFIDTDFKFSVLQLAVFLERLVLSGVEAQSKTKNFEELKQNSDTAQCSGNLCQKGEMSSNQMPIDGNQTCTTEQKSGGKRSSSEAVSLSAEDVDSIVQESLGRVQVYRVSSSLQLLATLHSLEQSLLTDADVPLVVIDSISAFFWLDREEDSENSNGTEKRMKPVAEVIAKLSQEFGVTFLVTKSALIGTKRNWADGEFWQGRTNVASSDLAQSEAHLTESQSEHVEFLGKSWLNLQPERIILTRRVSAGGRLEFVASSESWANERTFAIVNDQLKFL